MRWWGKRTERWDLGQKEASKRYFEIDTKIEGFEARADPRKPSGTGISRSAGVKESSSDHTDIAEAP